MNTLAKINRAKYEVAEEMLEQLEVHYSNSKGDIENFYSSMIWYINREHLFKSDYTK